MSARRAAAIGALLLGFGGFGLAVVVALQEFPRGLIALTCVAVAVAGAWYGVLRRGALRVAGLCVGALGLGAAIVLLVSDRLLEELLVVAALVLSCACARAAFSVRAHLPRVPAPRQPVLFFNPKSGGGKAERFALAAEARARGIEPIELRPGRDLEGLVRDAVAGGADGLAMAGGDGSQAVVAAIAAELDLPYACVPAGTRNHFALDLGSIETTSSARSTRSSTAVSAALTWRRSQRARVRQQRLARPLRRRGPAHGLPRREAANPARYRA